MFLFARLVLPFVFFALALFYVFVPRRPADQPFDPSAARLRRRRLCRLLRAEHLSSPTSVAKRKKSIQRAWPDALDLMLICVESGMSIEAAFRRVAEEIGVQSSPLAEELVLTNAELSYLQDRRRPTRTSATAPASTASSRVSQALIQAERYGTPVAQALRVLAQESRDMRMNEAEKKAAALPPKLTVPMILFFLPVLFAVILGPAGIQVSARGGIF